MIKDVANYTIAQFENLNEFGVFHFTTTKQGWKVGDESRFTYKVGACHELYLNELKEKIIPDCNELYFPKQTHSSNVLIVDESTHASQLDDVDALICNIPCIAIGIQTADCVPILLFDPQKLIVAAIHAGWRGTVGLIVSKTIEQMVNCFDCNPQHIIAGIGPSISKFNYEVGDEVIEQFESVFTNYKSLLSYSESKNGKAFLDLWQANKYLLLKAGLNERNIEITGLCSFANKSYFYSARRDGANTGRMASVIML